MPTATDDFVLPSQQKNADANFVLPSQQSDDSGFMLPSQADALRQANITGRFSSGTPGQLSDPDNLLAGDGSSGFAPSSATPWQNQSNAKNSKPGDALLAQFSGQDLLPSQQDKLLRAVNDANTPALPVSSTAGQVASAALAPPKTFQDIVDVGRGIQQNNKDTTAAMRAMATKAGLDPDEVAPLPGLVESWLRGGGNAVVDTALGLTSPGMLATGGMASMPSAVQKAASLGFAAQMAAEFRAVHHRHIIVGDDQIRIFVFDHLQAFLAVAGFGDGVEFRQA